MESKETDPQPAENDRAPTAERGTNIQFPKTAALSKVRQKGNMFSPSDFAKPQEPALT